MQKVHKKLVIYTLAVLLIGNLFVISYYALKNPEPVVIDVSKGLTFGKTKAPVDIVLFEDVLCRNCKWFMHTIFPQIKKNYIDTGKARFTIIPVAFLQGSREVSNAMICVYQFNPKQFFPFMNAIMEFGETFDKDELIYLASRVGKIPLGSLEKCIDMDRYFSILRQNYETGKETMGDAFGTPSLFIDGVHTPYYSYATIALRIEKGATK